MSSGRKSVKPSLVNGTNSTMNNQPTKVPLKTSGNGSSTSGLSSISSFSQSKAKAQSQEDLTKVKERPSSRTKPPGLSSSSGRRPAATKEGQRTSSERLSRDKSRPSSASSTAGSKSTIAGGRNSTSQKRKDSSGSIHRRKASLEAKIKDLVATAKDKDSEIKSLKDRLETMNQRMDQLQANSNPRNEVGGSEFDSPSSEETLPVEPVCQASSEELQSLKHILLREGRRHMAQTTSKLVSYYQLFEHQLFIHP